MEKRFFSPREGKGMIRSFSGNFQGDKWKRGKSLGKPWRGNSGRNWALKRQWESYSMPLSTLIRGTPCFL